MSRNSNNRAPPRSYSSVASQAAALKSQSAAQAPNAANAASPAPAAQVPNPAPAAAAARTPSVLQLMNEQLKDMDKTTVHLQRNAFRFRIQSFAGKEVEVDMSDGSRVVGILYTSTLYPHIENKEIVVKASKVFDKSGHLSSDYVPGATILLKYSNVVCLQGRIPDAPTRVQTSDFETDSNIRKHGDMSHLQGRELQSVANSWLDASTEASLESGAAAWDQFEANKRLFNVRSSFDENLYTKRLDLDAITPEQKARAERLAREIESSSSQNIHLQEERGQQLQQEFDEETLYSGVVREEKKNKAATENVWKRGHKLFDSPTPNTPPSSAATSHPAAGGKGRSAGSLSPPGLAQQPSQQQQRKEGRETTKGLSSLQGPKDATASADASASVAAPSAAPSLPASGATSSSGTSSGAESPAAVAAPAAAGSSISPSSGLASAGSVTSSTPGAEASTQAAPSSSTAAATATPAATATATTATTTPAKPAEPTPEKKASTFKLNPNAATFSFNVGAVEFKPAMPAYSMPVTGYVPSAVVVPNAPPAAHAPPAAMASAPVHSMPPVPPLTQTTHQHPHGGSPITKPEHAPHMLPQPPVTAHHPAASSATHMPYMQGSAYPMQAQARGDYGYSAPMTAMPTSMAAMSPYYAQGGFSYSADYANPMGMEQMMVQVPSPYMYYAPMTTGPGRTGVPPGAQGMNMGYPSHAMPANVAGGMPPVTAQGGYYAAQGYPGYAPYPGGQYPRTNKNHPRGDRNERRNNSNSSSGTGSAPRNKYNQQHFHGQPYENVASSSPSTATSGTAAAGTTSPAGTEATASSLGAPSMSTSAAAGTASAAGVQGEERATSGSAMPALAPAEEGK